MNNQDGQVTDKVLQPASQDVEVNPEMVVLARESRGFTQQEFAERLAVSQGWLSRVESGLRSPSGSALEKISEATGYPQSFFSQKDKLYGIDVSTMFHRKRQDVPLKQLSKIHAQINIRRMQIARMIKGLDLGQISFRTFDIEDFNGNIENIAQAVRAYWKVPMGPIHNLVRLIEDARGIVIPMDFETNRIDAIAQWPPDTPPLFFVNTHSPGDRLRFTLCHELGHIFMHQRDPNPDMESQADRFAGQFLLPDKEIHPFLLNLSLQQLASLKPYWKVSMAALVMRAKHLGLLSPWQERTLWTQMGPFRKKEPEELDIPRESPSLLQEIIDAYRQELKYSAAEFGKVIHLFEEEVRQLYYQPLRHIRAVK